MKKVLLSCFFLGFVMMSIAQVCNDDLYLESPTDFSYIGTVDAWGSTNSGYIVDVDEQGSTEICGYLQGWPYCDVVVDEEIVTVYGDDGVCFSEDNFYVDIIDTKFEYEIDECGTVMLKNISDPVSAKTFQTVNMTQLMEDGLKSYEYLITDYDKGTTVTRISIAGDSLYLEGGNYNIELKLKGIDDRANHFEDIFTTSKKDFVEVEDSICQGEVYVVGSEEIYDEGEYLVTLINEAGCDSTVLLYLVYKTSNCTVTGFEDNNYGLEVYPQPADEYIRIQGQKFFDIQLMNILGETIKTIQVKEEGVSVDVSDLKSGVYFLKSIDEMHKIIIE